MQILYALPFLLLLLLDRDVRNTIKNIFQKIEHLIWGNIKAEELSKFLYLAVIAIIAMTCTWGLKTLKDSLFIDFVGPTFLTHAKIVSIAILIPLVFFYNYIAARISLEKIFTFICYFYGSLFLGIGTLCFLANAQVPLPIPTSLIGWLAYVGTESFSSLLVSHYFTYLASINTTESAKRGYGLIIVATQIGNLLGPTCVIFAIKAVGFSNLLYFFGSLIFVIPSLIYLFIRKIPASLRTSDETKLITESSSVHAQTADKSFFTGIKLLYHNPYLLGLATITSMHEIISQMLDLQFKIQISQHFHGADFAAYMGSYAQMNAILGIIFGFFGTSFLLRKLEIKNCLILYPLLLASIVSLVWYFPATQFFFAGMIAIKTLGYTLNRPINEIMFIPTTKSVKTQVKSIVDSLGKRGGKALGASILSSLSNLQLPLLTATTYTSLALLTVWVGVATATGKKYESLVKNKDIIG
jgi:ATP/ADP translocase